MYGDTIFTKSQIVDRIVVVREKKIKPDFAEIRPVDISHGQPHSEGQTAGRPANLMRIHGSKPG